ncbi:TPA: hypothetical protein DIV55_00320 [Patescibacteria group bacterium]|uniref:Bacterial Ig-like domain-containing protein n=1 Tax=Candidatus Gottesmanbacteria bacterium GW2011_GWA1_43_11 TaxID=1618436 RepID=A0A0G1CDZ7_9BACT|nr:MAG: hypothetical protein UV59_C0032G0015 [Candidatus Gottesmanbacteria bacterium GW2011_GWA1_43_11]HCS78171.1 hypothetical protein [Patescibacteria group bacterium]
MDQVSVPSTANKTSESSRQFSAVPPPKKISPIFFIALGVLISLGVAAFIWFRPFTFQQPATSVTTSPNPVAQTLTLELTSPADGTLSVNQEILVTGKTLPNTTVMLFTETDENSVQSDAGGMFESTITLVNGINSLTVTVFGEDGTEKSQSMDLVYDSET